MFCAFKCLCIHTPSQDWSCYWSRTYRIYTNALSNKLRCDHASERTHGGLTFRISTSSRVRHLVNDGAAKNDSASSCHMRKCLLDCKERTLRIDRECLVKNLLRYTRRLSHAIKYLRLQRECRFARTST